MFIPTQKKQCQVASPERKREQQIFVICTRLYKSFCQLIRLLVGWSVGPSLITRYKVFPTGGGGFRLTNSNQSRCTAILTKLRKAVMLGTCTGYFSLKEIGFVAFAIRISSYRIFELRQNSMHFVKKSHR